MRTISQKEYAMFIEDEVASRVYVLLEGLMEHFDKMGIVERSPMEEWSDDMEELTIEAAENLKDAVIEELEKMGLAVEGDGRDF